MADDYREIVSTETDPLAPLVAALMKALEQNPRAIAACSVDSPVNKASWHPHDAVVHGDSTGTLFDFAIDGAINTVTSPDFIDGYDYRLIAVGISGSSTQLDLQVQRQDTSAWVDYANLAIISSTIISHSWEFIHPRQTDRYKLITPVGDASADSFDLGAATKIKAIRIANPVAHNFDSGRIVLQKRYNFQ